MSQSIATDCAEAAQDGPFATAADAAAAVHVLNHRLDLTVKSGAVDGWAAADAAQIRTYVEDLGDQVPHMVDATSAVAGARE